MLTKRLLRTFPSPTTLLSAWVTMHDSERRLTMHVRSQEALVWVRIYWKSHLGLAKAYHHTGSLMLLFRPDDELFTGRRPSDFSIFILSGSQSRVVRSCNAAYTAWRKHDCLMSSKLDCVAYSVRKRLFRSCLVLLTPCRCDCPIRYPYNPITPRFGKRDI